MKFETFHSLLAVVETGSMAKAAQQLNLTPSAVSMQIKQLEQYMGASLFDRSGQSVRAKPLALDLVEITHPWLKRIESLRHHQDIQIKGVVRLGLLDTMLPLLLPRTLQHVQNDYPLLELRMSRGKSKTLQQQVRASDLDLAVLAQPVDFIPSKGLIWQPLLERPLVLIAPPGTTLQADDLFRKHRYIAYDRNTTTGVMASRYVEQTYGVRKADFEYDSIPAIVSMVSLGIGISVLQIADKRLLQTDAVEVIPLSSDAPKIQYAMLISQSGAEKRSTQAVVRVLREVASKL